MLFIVALIISIIFVAVFKELLKKYPNIFYITAAVISIAAFVCSSYVTMPGWVRDYVVGIFAKGSLGTAFFVLVMYAGAMKNTWKAIWKNIFQNVIHKYKEPVSCTDDSGDYKPCSYNNNAYSYSHIISTGKKEDEC